MVIDKKANMNVAAKEGKMSQAVLDTQTNFVTPEVRGQDVLLEHESLDDDDVERNADLYIFDHEVAQS